MFFSQAKTPPTYFLIDSLKKVDWLKNELLKSPLFSTDIETNWPTAKGMKVERNYPEKIAGVSFAWKRESFKFPWTPGTAVYLPLIKADDSAYWGDKQDYVLGVLREILEGPAKKVLQNGKFDISKLFLLEDIRVNNFYFDTMLAHSCLDEDRHISSHALKSDISEEGNVVKLGMGDAYLGEATSLFKEDLTSSLVYYDPHLKRYSKVPVNILAPYGCADADLTLSLYFVFEQMLEEEGMAWLFQNIVMPLSHAVMVMEINGMPLDIERANQVVNEQAAIMEEAQREVWGVLGKEFNVGSNEQLGKILFEELKLSGEKGDHGKWKVDVDALSVLDHPIIHSVLKYRRAQKIGKTYAEAALGFVKEISEDGKLGTVHVQFWLDTLTGRLRCSDPNLQNLPRVENGGDIVKSLWRTPDDYRFVFKDFSQIELRMAAHLSAEPSWVHSFVNGIDIHSTTAKNVFHLPCDVSEVKKLYKKERSDAKTVNFGILYGQSVFALGKSLGIPYEEADKLINEDYFGAAPVLKCWIDGVGEFVRTNGYITDMFGRRRHMPEAMMEIPASLPWPDDSVRPSCYRNGPYLSYLNIDPADLYDLSELKIKQLIKLRGKNSPFAHCISCPHTVSCLVNREVKFVKSKVARAVRQATNLPVQGGSASLVSLCLIEITKDLVQHNLRASTNMMIHDEICVISHVDDIEQVCSLMDYRMTRWVKDFTNFSVPLEVDTEIVQCWGDKH